MADIYIHGIVDIQAIPLLDEGEAPNMAREYRIEITCEDGSRHAIGLYPADGTDLTVEAYSSNLSAL
jgi:hypothetical protein